MSALADELGVTALAAKVDALTERLDALVTPPEFYKAEEVVALLRISRESVDQLLARGDLWKLDLPGRTIRIPRAAVESLQERPAKLRRVS